MRQRVNNQTGGSPLSVLDRIQSREARIAVLGQGYVGLVVAMRACEAGFEVVGYEPDPWRASELAAGRSYIEDVADATLQAALEAGYTPTADPQDLAGFDVATINVPTPLRDGNPDLSFIRDAAELLAQHLRPDTLTILESTTYPGTTEELLAPTLAAGSGLTVGTDFLVGYSPERIDPGNPRFGLHNTPKVVSGIDEASLAAVSAFFGAFVEQVVPVSSPGEAELTKIIENTFRHVNIALVNEVAMFAYDLGVDASEAIEAAATKPFGYMRFTPGPGVGGHCLPIDPTYLSWRVKQHLGESFRFIELANDVNEHMPGYVVRRAQALLNRQRKPVNGSRIVLLGLSYKPNVGDMREAPGNAVITHLLDLGAEVVVVDPHIPVTELSDGVHFQRDLDDRALDGADLAIIITNHDAFDHQWLSSGSVPILDTRSCLDPKLDHVERL